MNPRITIGLARMHHESGEKRDFLPGFVGRLNKLGARVVLEHGYGAGMDLSEEEYRKAAPGVAFASHEEVYTQEHVLVLRCPPDVALRLMRPGATLISMLHFPTRPGRVETLRALGLQAVSLDSIKDDVGRRLVENLRAVAWNGLEAAFRVLARTYPPPGLEASDRGPVHATVLGVGAVGVHAVQAASRYGDPRLWQSLARRGVPGVQVTAVEHDLTCREAVMRVILGRSDILVDATQRPDPGRAVIPNEWVAWMPEHAVLVDLSVDPYDCTAGRREVKGIEGIPQGDLDQYVFAPDDPAFGRVPDCVPTRHRRHTVSCYSWPGIHPRECMTVYGHQLRPLMRTLIEKGGAAHVNPKGKFFERALARALLSAWPG
jgi:alanine dehydrogenase